MKALPSFKQVLIASCLMFAGHLSAYADSPQDAISKEQKDCSGEARPFEYNHEMHDMHDMNGTGGSFSGPPPMHGGMPPPPFMEDNGFPPFLHGLHLTESQEDKIFNIIHNMAPALRDQDKIIRKTAIQFHQSATSDQYDEGKLNALAADHAKAMATAMLLHARQMHQIREVLTAEQRTQMEATKPENDKKH